MFRILDDDVDTLTLKRPETRARNGALLADTWRYRGQFSQARGASIKSDEIVNSIAMIHVHTTLVRYTRSSPEIGLKLTDEFFRPVVIRVRSYRFRKTSRVMLFGP